MVNVGKYAILCHTWSNWVSITLYLWLSWICQWYRLASWWNEFTRFCTGANRARAEANEFHHGPAVHKWRYSVFIARNGSMMYLPIFFNHFLSTLPLADGNLCFQQKTYCLNRNEFYHMVWDCHPRIGSPVNQHVQRDGFQH